KRRVCLSCPYRLRSRLTFRLLGSGAWRAGSPEHCYFQAAFLPSHGRTQENTTPKINFTARRDTRRAISTSVAAEQLAPIQPGLRQEQSLRKPQRAAMETNVFRLSGGSPVLLQ